MKDRIREWWYEVVMKRWGWYYKTKVVHIWVTTPSETDKIENWLMDGYSIEATHLSSDDTVLYILTERVRVKW